MTTQATKALVSIAYDATRVVNQAEKLAEFRDKLQVFSRDGTNEALLEIAELLAYHGHPNTWQQA